MACPCLAFLAYGVCKHLGIVICGGNIDSRILSQVLMCCMVRDGRVTTLRIQITDLPASSAPSPRPSAMRGNIIEKYDQGRSNDLPANKLDGGDATRARRRRCGERNNRSPNKLDEGAS